jgi:hypothetical protein
MLRAILVVAGVGTLVAIELATPPRTANAVNEPVVAQPASGVRDLPDTLTKVDRLAIPYFQNELSTQQMSFVERMPPADTTLIIPKEAPKLVNGSRHNAKIKKLAAVHPKPKPDSKPRPKTTDSKTVTNTDRSKVPLDVTPCRLSGFDRFLKALNLSSGCET